MIVPAGYMFEDNMGGGEASPRGPRRDLGTEKKPEAAGTPGGDSAEETDAGEPEEDELQPTGRKRRGKLRKSDKPATAGCEAGGEPQPAAKKRPGRPQKKSAADLNGSTAEEEVAPNPGGQPQALRRGHLAPKGQRDRGRSC